MEALHQPDEEIIEQIDSICDPFRTPERFVVFLARWVDLERIFAPHHESAGPEESPISTGLGRLRELTRTAATLARWRGTRRGLILFLETATGIPGFNIDDRVVTAEGALTPFHIRVTAPKAAEPHRPLLERIIEVERPAYVTWELVFKE